MSDDPNLGSQAYSYGSTDAFVNAPCSGDYFVSASHRYSLKGRHRDWFLTDFNTFDHLAFVPAGGFAALPNLNMDRFSNFQNAATPTVAPNDGVSVQYTGRT